MVTNLLFSQVYYCLCNQPEQLHLLRLKHRKHYQLNLCGSVVTPSFVFTLFILLSVATFHALDP